MKLSDLFLNRWLFKSSQTEATTDASSQSINQTTPSDLLAAGGSNSAFEVNTNPGTVSGDKIRTGAVESTNYAYTIGNTYSTAGTSFDLNNGNIISNQFSIINGNATFAGTITAAKIDIPNATAGASFHVDTGGNMWIGANASSFASAPFRVYNTGAAYCDNLSVATSVWAGGTITGTVITGGTVRTSSGTTRVEMAGAANELNVYSSGNLAMRLASNYLSFYDSGATLSGTIGVVTVFAGNTERSIITQANNGTKYSELVLTGVSNGTAKLALQVRDNVGNINGQLTIANNGTVGLLGSTSSSVASSGSPFNQGYFSNLTLGGVSRSSWPSALTIYWGYVSGTSLSKNNFSFSISKPSTGNYTVTHNFGSTNYVVNATAVRGSGLGAYTAKIESINSNDFKIVVFDDTGAAVDSDFTFSLFKN